MTETEIKQGDVFDLLPDLPDDYGHAAVVDYPWEFDTQNGTDRFGHNSLTGEDDLYVLEENEGLAAVIDHLPRVVADGGWVFVFADDDRLLEPFFGTAPGLAVARERDLDYWGADVSDEAHARATERIVEAASND